MENINACVAVDVLLSSGIVTLTSTFMKEMKRSGYGALSLVTPGGKSNITISKCIVQGYFNERSERKDCQNSLWKWECRDGKKFWTVS